MTITAIFRAGLLITAATVPFNAAQAQADQTGGNVTVDLQPEAEEPDNPFAIIVTAQRRAEDVQDIPVAISAFSGEKLERSGPITLESVAPRVPSFYFGSFGASRPQLYIRGIGTRSFDPGSESSVGVFVDDVYLGRASGSFGSLRDVERVEVLRGPQGTLYGRNTIGGAINVISKAPTDYFTGDFNASLTNFEGIEMSAGIGGPITEDGSLKFRAAGWHSEREGYMTNSLTGNTFQGIDNTGGRLRLAFEPGDRRLRIGLSAEYIEDGNEAAFSGFNTGSGPVENAMTGAMTPANPASVFLAAPGSMPIVYAGGTTGPLSLDPTLDRRSETYIGRIEYDFDFATITSISALRELRTQEARDLEGSSLSVIDQFSRENSRQFTQELRITSDPSGPASFGGNLDWIVGLFYYRDRSSRSDRFELGPDSVIAFLTGQTPTDVASSNYEIDSYAIFGQATLHIGENFDLTLGARFTRDEKRAVQTGTSTLPGAPLVVTPFTTDNSAVYESFNPRVTATYRLSPDVSVYATYSTGFKSGGFQYVPFAASQANVLFEPEDIKTYELGLKTEFLDRRARLNIAAFHYDYSNLQVSRIVDLGGGAAASLITNAASSSVDGVDFELQLRPSDNFDFDIAYGYLDAKYDSYIFNAATDFSGTALVRSPKHSINIGAEWRIPLGEDTQFAMRGDYAMLSDFFHEPGEADPLFGGATSLSGEDGYGLLDLSATLSYGDFNLTAFARNLTKVDYRRTVLALGSTLSDFPGTPRIYGLKVGYSF